MIKTSSHSIKFANTHKRETVSLFISEYRRVAKFIIDSIWDDGYEYSIGGNSFKFYPKENFLDTPKYIDYKRFKLETILTARALSSLVTQIAGMLSAATEKQRKRLYILDSNKEQNTTKRSRNALIRKIKQNIPQKPYVGNLNPELSSKCCSWISQTDTTYDGFIKLSAIIKSTKAIYIPIKQHKLSNKFNKIGAMKTSFLIKENSIDFRWDIIPPKIKSAGIIVGADQGAKTVLTLSDTQSTGKDNHGHDLDSIMKILSRKKKGSKSFKRTQCHRENHINWAINQLDLSTIKEIRLERIYNIGYRNNKSRYLQHFTNTIIRDKVESIALENGVHLIEQESTYRSQRCSCCGVVRKANRKGKIYECSHCGNIMDADLNASMNHEQNLPEVPYTLRKRNLNRSGFFWKEDGFYDFEGRSLESLPLVEDN